MADLLSDDMIADRLERLEDWSLNDDADYIERSIEFGGFLEAIDFISRIAPLAEAANHHPEIFNVYNQVDLALSTHDAGGLTEKDFDLAEEIDAEV